ncbi:hypothetical protein OCH239_03795 [Roseivivax halodurans JCM 10272]|uniref:Cytochrome c-552/4 domain-containing protein n=1 Tax=Roseivivax halodurans JCM 10272 TaxID=1449350 RepID=X7EGW6_9RHOB|nr:hypothetical protein [Roseivivax halodurans]ETX14431.1 hypothetical protein OCH239_03795 [Roseivivax halodurans JCM 10272]
MRPVALAIALALAVLAPPASAQSPHEVYGAACAAAIAPIPGFDCADGVTIPITIDGMEITDRAPETCDRPGLLDNGPGSDGQCVPFSRILNLSTETAQVSVMCRQKRLRSADSPEFDEIDVIAHNPATGATCWFQAVNTKAAPVLGAAVPSPTGPDGEGFWEPPETVVAEECGSCHDNDPFMYSPFVGQVWDHVPTNPLGPYAHVDAGFGFAGWPTHEMQPRDNTCLGCHRIGTGFLAPPAASAGKPGSCGQLASWMTGAPAPGGDEAAKSYPLSHAMPPYFGLSEEAWEEVYGASVAAVRSCCADSTKPFCNIREIRSYLEEGSVP